MLGVVTAAVFVVVVLCEYNVQAQIVGHIVPHSHDDGRFVILFLFLQCTVNSYMLSLLLF